MSRFAPSDPELPHRFDVEVVVDSEIASGTILYFCAGCGQPRTPKMRKITRDTVCVERPAAEVQKRINSRVDLLKAMIHGRDNPDGRNYGSRMGRSKFKR